ncbi:MAG: PfkB family carbohydrate kinase [Patescibacteria group bacterium]|nr:PfkB family carbohydrate kinase [Patescibacteria group bacterium]
MLKLAFIGDLTVDIYPALNKRVLGGSSLTSALWAKKLGAKVSIMAAVGDDLLRIRHSGEPPVGGDSRIKNGFRTQLRKSYAGQASQNDVGTEFIDFCKQEKINTDFIKVIPGKTSSIEIFLDQNGERTWGKWNPGALAGYHLDKKDYDFLKTQDAVSMPVYYKTRHLLKELLTIADRKPSPLVVIDFDDLSQFQKSTKIIEDNLPYIDIVLCGLDMVSDAKIIRKLQKLALKRCDFVQGRTLQKIFVVTLNKNGSLAFFGNKVFRQKADKIKTINSNGAGDAFLAGFLVEYLKSKSITKSLRKGTRVATMAIS